MDEQVPVVETPQGEQTTETAAEAPLSIMEHVAQFDPQHKSEPDDSGDGTDAPLAADATPEQRAAHHSAQQRRERETGKFTEGKKRSRGKDAVQRIDQLTGRAKTAEEKLAAAEAELAKLRSAPAQTAPVTPQVAPTTSVVQTPPGFQPRRAFDPRDPEPQEKDFGGDPMKFLDARFEWLARATYRYDQQQAQQQQQVLQRATSWAQRVEKAVQKYADYAAVAFGPTTIPNGSPMDQFIDGDDNGAEVLYYLQSNPAERDAVLRMPVIQQMKHLAALSQRFDASPQSSTPGVTGSGATPKVRFLAPRPPNPVRTEPQRAENKAAPTDGSLTVTQHAKRFAR